MRGKTWSRFAVRKVSCDGIYLQSLDLASDLGFAGDESKLNTRDALALGNRKDCVKGATIPASHVLGTNQWPAQRRKRLNTEPQTSPAIRNWELDDVGLAQSDRYRHCFFGRIRPITTPNTASSMAAADISHVPQAEAFGKSSFTRRTFAGTSACSSRCQAI